MTIQEKFKGFKNEIKEVIENECLSDLEVNSCSTLDLIFSGYIKRKIESFMYINEFSVKELDEYFRDHCNNVCASYFGQIPESEYRYPVRDFINNLKYNSVVFALSNDLAVYISMLKGENASIN
ncbi:MAG: hypothetical protein JSS91_07580 [Bacteroidetes bacterium]|nr:hypothetical protein [Bacteroidota bacterium]